MALTTTKITKLKEPGRYGDGHHLYLQVMSPTNRSWLFRYTRGGKTREMGLGPIHTFSLEEARELAREARKLLAAGVDPIEHRRVSATPPAPRRNSTSPSNQRPRTSSTSGKTSGGTPSTGNSGATLFSNTSIQRSEAVWFTTSTRR